MHRRMPGHSPHGISRHVCRKESRALACAIGPQVPLMEGAQEALKGTGTVKVTQCVNMQDSDYAIQELKYTIDRLYHPGDLIHVFHIVPDSGGTRLFKRSSNVNPDDEALAQKYFDDYLLPVLQARDDVNFVYEITREAEVPGARKSKSIGEAIDLRAIVIGASAIITTCHIRGHEHKDPETGLGSMDKYLVKHGSHPVILIRNSAAV